MNQDYQIVWFETAKGHKPVSSEEFVNVLAYNSVSNFLTTGFYSTKLDRFLLNGTNKKPTHFAYINYPK